MIVKYLCIKQKGKVMKGQKTIKDYINNTFKVLPKQKISTNKQLQSQANIIKSALLKIQQKHKNMISKKQAEIPVISISSQSDSQPEKENIIAEELVPQVQQNSNVLPSAISSQRDGLVQSKSQRIAQIIDQQIPQPTTKQGRQSVEVTDVCIQVSWPRRLPNAVVLQIRDEDGEQFIDILQFDQIKTYKRSYAEDHYIDPLIYYLQDNVCLDLGTPFLQKS